MLLKDLPLDARPREKMLAGGAAALADVELIALLLRTGARGVSALQLAQRLLDQCGGVRGLLQAGPGDLRGLPGLGPAKCAEIGAVAELARRALREELGARTVLDAPDKVKDYLKLHFGGLRHEVFGVMFLDTRNRLIRLEEMFRGTLSQTSVYPREVVRRALDLHAAAVILVHNHPSGDTEPSAADEALTRSLIAALRLVDVRVLDHFIVGEGAGCSFAERGLM